MEPGTEEIRVFSEEEAQVKELVALCEQQDREIAALKLVEAEAKHNLKNLEAEVCFLKGLLYVCHEIKNLKPDQIDELQQRSRELKRELELKGEAALLKDK